MVIPGTRPKQYPAGTYQIPCALIVGRRSPSTDRKVSLNQALRDFEVQVQVPLQAPPGGEVAESLAQRTAALCGMFSPIGQEARSATRSRPGRGRASRASSG